MPETVILHLTSEELDIVYDALEEVRLAGGWTNDRAEEVAGVVQDKIVVASREYRYD